MSRTVLTPDKLIYYAKMYGRTITQEQAERVCEMLTGLKTKEEEKICKRRHSASPRPKLVGLKCNLVSIDEPPGKYDLQLTVYEMLAHPPTK